MKRKKTNRAIDNSFTLAGIKAETLIPLAVIMALVFILLRAINVSMEASLVIAFFMYLGWLLLNSGNNRRYIAMLIRSGTPSFRLGKGEPYKPLLKNIRDSGGDDAWL